MFLLGPKPAGTYFFCIESLSRRALDQDQNQDQDQSRQPVKQPKFLLGPRQPDEQPEGSPGSSDSSPEGFQAAHKDAEGHTRQAAIFPAASQGTQGQSPSKSTRHPSRHSSIPGRVVKP